MRDLGRLTDQRYDLLVIGGGIHGLFAAWDAARRGLSVVLIDKHDYGSGLSFNHQRTVHGGLRALESFQFGKAAEQIAERRRWALIAPALVRPLPFLVPIRRAERPSRLVLAAGLRLYDALGAHRNDGLPPHLQLPPSQVLSPAEGRARCPELPADNLIGAAVWHDYQTVYPDRLNWLVALAARQAGAVLANYVAPISAHRTRGRLTGVRACDQISRRQFDLWADACLITAGAGMAEVFRALDLDDEPPPLVAAANILINRPAIDMAIAARGPHGRRLTAVPWAGRTLVGTFQGHGPTTPDRPFPIDVDTMLAETNATFPWLDVRPPDVHTVHRGLVPASLTGPSVELLPEPRLIHHAPRGVPNVVSLAGVKFTTARLAARRALDALVASADLRSAPALDDANPLPHASHDTLDPDARSRGVRLGLDEDTLRHLGAWYGTEANDVLAYAERTGLTDRVCSSSPVIGAEIGYAARYADAVTPEDAAYRRTWLGAGSSVEQAVLDRVQSLMTAARDPR